MLDVPAWYVHNKDLHPMEFKQSLKDLEKIEHMLKAPVHTFCKLLADALHHLN